MQFAVRFQYVAQSYDGKAACAWEQKETESRPIWQRRLALPRVPLVQQVVRMKVPPSCSCPVRAAPTRSDGRARGSYMNVETVGPCR